MPDMRHSKNDKSLNYNEWWPAEIIFFLSHCISLRNSWNFSCAALSLKPSNVEKCPSYSCPGQNLKIYQHLPRSISAWKVCWEWFWATTACEVSSISINLTELSTILCLKLSNGCGGNLNFDWLQKLIFCKCLSERFFFFFNLYSGLWNNLLRHRFKQR